MAKITDWSNAIMKMP